MQQDLENNSQLDDDTCNNTYNNNNNNNDSSSIHNQEHYPEDDSICSTNNNDHSVQHSHHEFHEFHETHLKTRGRANTATVGAIDDLFDWFRLGTTVWEGENVNTTKLSTGFYLIIIIFFCYKISGVFIIISFIF